MSNNEKIRENNKKLFESRLQIKPNSSLTINQINMRITKNKNKDRNDLFLFNTDIYSNEISQSNFIKKNISVDKKISKITKNKNKGSFLSKNNLSNLIIKDISFFHTKNKSIKNDFQVINVNKKITNNNSRNKTKNHERINTKKEKKGNFNINSISKKRNNINQNKFSLSYLNFTCDNYAKLINKNKPKSSKLKIFLNENKSQKIRNSSSIKKDSHRYNSFLIQKIKIIKKKQKPFLNNINFKANKNNNINKKNILNKTGLNIKSSINDKGNKNKFERNTYRNLFLRKDIIPTNKNSFISINFSTNNNRSTLNYKKKESERNLKEKNINNKLTLNQKHIKEHKNNINKKKFVNKYRNKNDKNQKNKEISKNAKTVKEINSIYYQNILNNNKYIDKKEEIIDDFNIKSTNTNDDIFTEEKNEKIEESSIEEESGILSMNEIEDIICYNNMKDINKDDNYLFNKNDYKTFLDEYNSKLCKLFFENNNNNACSNKKKQINSDNKLFNKKIIITD